ncbi:hypothetical protein HID58_054404, partial [Brassica napus]
EKEVQSDTLKEIGMADAEVYEWLNLNYSSSPPRQVSLAGGIVSDPIGDCEIAIEYASHFRSTQVGVSEMRESSDIKDLISYGDDLINLPNSKNGFGVVSQSFDHSKALHFTCDEDFNQIQESIKDCKKKLEACKKKTEEAYSDESAGDDDIEHLNAQWTSVDEKRQSLKSKDRDDLRAEKKLSMYACVTKVIPEAGVNDPSKISG